MALLLGRVMCCESRVAGACDGVNTVMSIPYRSNNMTNASSLMLTGTASYRDTF